MGSHLRGLHSGERGVQLGVAGCDQQGDQCQVRGPPHAGRVGAALSGIVYASYGALHWMPCVLVFYWC
jgi:hypothetical protein